MMSRLLLFLFLLATSISDVYASGIDDYYEVKTFIDSSQQLSINQVIDNELFTISDVNRNTIFYGFNTHALWIQLKPKNLDKNYIVIQNAHLDSIEFFALRGDSIIKHIKTGDRSNYNSREYPGLFFTFQIPSTTDAVYFRIRTEGMGSIPFQVQPEKGFIQLIHSSSVIHYIYIGFFLLIVFLNLLIYFKFKEKINLFYILSLIALFIVFANDFHYLFYYLYPEVPAINQFATVVYSLFGLIFIFPYYFLKINKSKKLKHIYRILFYIAILHFLISIIGSYELSIVMFINIVIAAPFLLIVFGVLAYRITRERSAIYFIIAFVLHVVFLLINFFSYFGYIPFNVFTENAYIIGQIIEITILFMAVIDQFNYYREKSALSNMLLLEALQHNELILTEQKENLEKGIAERTAEIESLNEELAANNEELLQNNDEMQAINSALSDQKIALEIALRKLKETQDQLIQNEKLASIGILTAGIAHEINNPVNFISSGIQGLEAQIDDIISVQNEYSKLTRENYDTQIEIINNLKEKLKFNRNLLMVPAVLKNIFIGVKRTNEIVQGLKMFSRTDDQEKTETHVEDIIETSLLILTNRYKNKIEIVKQYGQIPAIRIKQGKIHQLILNILSNAIDAVCETSDKCENGKIEISTSLSIHNTLVIEISDNGKGIPEKHLTKIFDPFYTTKSVGKGTGLGLYLSYEIISEHNGSIKVRNKPSEGAIFTIEIPYS